MLRTILSGALIISALAGCAAQSAGDAMVWYGNHNGIAPKNTKIYVCHGFGCAYKTPVSMSAQEFSELEEILAVGTETPEAERKAISEAVQWQEKRVASKVGSQNDVGGYDMWNSGVRGQMDCIDESTNTNSLLLLAQKNGLLKHHKVSSPVGRGFFFDGRYPHATATVTATASGQAFAVDSWVRDNGEPPNVMATGRVVCAQARLTSGFCRHVRDCLRLKIERFSDRLTIDLGKWVT